MAGYKEWIENAEVKIDYFSAFLKAWMCCVAVWLMVI